MATIQDIGFILYNGFRPYVPKGKLQKYDDEFASKKRYSSKFLLMVFTKYVNEKTWMKKPKEKRDTYLFNYYYIEVPVNGIKYSPLLRRYIHDRYPRIKGFIKKSK